MNYDQYRISGLICHVRLLSKYYLSKTQSPTVNLKLLIDAYHVYRNVLTVAEAYKKNMQLLKMIQYDVFLTQIVWN